VQVANVTFPARATRCPDLRAGFSYVLAALAAQGDSTVTGISLLDRGYENFREKLIGVGAQLR
jgi:UDP-N-acetylglucosamine 1-carboxyvinyltransferase